MPSSWKGKTQPPKPDFADWKDHGEESLKAARSVAVKFRDDVVRLEAIHDRAGYTLTLCGISGTGKTFLGNCILNELGRNAWGNLNNVQGYVRGNQLMRANYMRRDWRKLSDGFKSGQFEILDDLKAHSSLCWTTLARTMTLPAWERANLIECCGREPGNGRY